MAYDPFQSRRNYNEPCKWWSRDERDRFESDELVMQRAPTGLFWAKEEGSEAFQNSVLGGSFMIDRSNVTIKSPDDLWGIKNNDLVEYQGGKWIVVSAQKRKARIQHSMYASDRNCSHYWYLELRK